MLERIKQLSFRKKKHTNRIQFTSLKKGKSKKSKMPTPVPPELKKITQYVRRAEELDKDKTNVESRLVAYYCRQYAVQTGIPLATASPNPATANATLGSLLENLEKEKPAMANFTKEESYMVCRGFAMKVFDRADAEDRAGNAGKNTAKSFFAASTFLDILKQFSEDIRVEEQALEEEKKSFYAKWKSTDILKAIKEGRQPTPGGYTDEKEEDEGGDEAGGTNEQQEEEEEEEEEHGVEVPFEETESSAPPPPPYPGISANPPLTTNRPPMTMSQPTAPSPPKQKSASPLRMFSKPSKKFENTSVSNVMNISNDSMKDAKEFTKAAIKALDKKNAQIAADYLQKALVHLGRTNDGDIGSSKISRNAMKDAKELSKFASKALDVKDADLAVERLEQALGCLGV